MYPVPPRAETQGRTERHIGTWLKARGNRDKVVIATKVAGRGGGPRGDFAWLRNDGQQPNLTRAQIMEAVDKSLKRPPTDRKSARWGRAVSERVELGGTRCQKK